MTNVACEVYSRDSGHVVEQRMLGYRQGVTSYRLVEFHRVVGKGGHEQFIERDLGEPFHATGLDTIPMSVQDRKAAYVSQLLSLGYSFQGKVLVNATTQAVKPVTDADVPADLLLDGVALNWLFTPPILPVLRGFLYGIFQKGASKLGYEIGQGDLRQGLLPDVLMHIPGQFELRIEDGQRENTLHPATLEGAGELRPQDGHKPLLMLVYFQHCLEKDFMLTRNEGFTFCDEQGETFKYTKFDSLEPLIERFGFDAEQVRRDAERLGLVTPIIRLAEIQADAEDCFF